ncbi:RrF2 family transcriptional regulator [Paenibacillus donghaensis]|uniref:Rrf2 family transcriptional regulator n=1 Tax=Paenibacillus donghaensis TaxID=414771 RepID=UPI0018848C3E|nr:RrF2 family transcriptional regulator [Paenibacillus donghaensis]MBE9914827.1 RrF2 family transcriptional regulator [Paenibacillus donghaensis]
MKFSKATDYALHTILDLIAESPNKPVRVQQLAEKQGVSPTYLSKILTKLAKAGLVESASGANGGYRLKARKEDISFLDVIHAIEGTASLFHCCLHDEEECDIRKVMISAEEAMEERLRNKKIIELVSK